MFLNANLDVEFYEAGYNRFEEEILYDTGSMWGFKPDIIYLHTTYRNLEFKNDINVEYQKYERVWKYIKDKSQAIIVQNNFELPPLRSFGNLESTHGKGHIRFINSLNEKIGMFSETPGFYVNDLNYLSARMGLERWYDASYWLNFKFAYSSEATITVAKSFLSIVQAIKGLSKKCLVLDLDNTLWGGVIGDDGLEGIGLGNGSARGEAYVEFQTYVKSLKERGVILAVCSKNELKTAKLGFTHSDSILKLDDFSSFQASWGMKTDALRLIAKELNIGLDSLVFIDDNPAERELIRTQLPEVEVPEVGTDVAEFAKHIDGNGYFESLKILNEDLNKSQYYAEGKKREAQAAEFENYAEFLLSLEMEAEIRAYDKQNLERINQLINKTNQFNLTTARTDIETVTEMVDNPNHVNLYARLKDKFGDNGLVACISATVDDGTANIDSWVMSCRVFKRELEFAHFDEFIKICEERSINRVKGKFVPSEKNSVVAELYKDLGFSKHSDTEWILENISTYKFRNRAIKINLQSKEV